MSNPYYTRNSDKNFYEEYQSDTNCGSFALNIQQWYDPHDCFDEEGNDFATDIYEVTDDIEYTTEQLLRRAKAGIAKDFYEEIYFIDSPYEYEEKENEELIAFRVGVETFGSSSYVSTDFHFRVFRDGRWQEKCGCGPVEDYIDLEPDEPWELYNWSYDSDIVYFVHKLGDEAHVA